MSEEKYKNIKKYDSAIRSCSGIGDCREAYLYAVKRIQVCPVYEHSPKFEVYNARGRLRVLLAILEGKLEASENLAKVFYQCTTCGSCHSICHHPYHNSIDLFINHYIDHVKILESFRADLFELKLLMPRHVEILDSIKKYNNPYFQNHEDRIKWAENRKFPETAEYVFFMGCTEPYKMQNLIKNIIDILDKSKLNYTIIHPNEVCCGSIALRIGVKTAKELMIKNLEGFKKAGAKKIIVHCAGCYKTLKFDYPDLLQDKLPFEIVHITELVDELIKDGKIKLTNEVKQKVSYHDPCHLGRNGLIYDTPRNILKSIPGLEFIEFERIKENAWCCGAGGGVKSAFPDLAKEIGKDRIKEAENLKVNSIISSCPFCEMNLKDSAEDLKSNVGINDIIELLIKSI